MDGVKRKPLKLSDYDGTFASGTAELPSEYILPKELIPDVRDQGEVNSCVAFASTGIMQIMNQTETGERVRFSPGYVYGKCRGDEDTYEGMVIPEALDYLKDTGACYESDFPENKEIPEIMELVRSRPDLDEKAKPYHIKGYETYAYAMKSKKYDAVKRAIYENQTPVLGDADFKQGSHAVCIIGWNDKKQTFKILNSWGENWGDHGIGDIAYSKLDKGYLLIDAENSDRLMPFRDVSPDEWYYKAVQHVYNAGLMNGTSDNTFEPERPLTRAEMAQILMNLSRKIDDVLNSGGK